MKFNRLVTQVFPVLAALLALLPGGARAGLPDMSIATVDLNMTQAQVLARLGSPLARTRVHHTGRWRYQDHLIVWLRRKHGPGSRLRVVGVRTRSPQDRVRFLSGVHVGTPARRLTRRLGATCFDATLPSPAGVRRAGRYCSWPMYLRTDPRTGEAADEPDFTVRAPILLFEIRKRRIAGITLQIQPPH